MAINESIPLQVQAPGIMGAAMGGLQAGQQFAANKQQQEQQANSVNAQALKYAHDTAVQLKAAPIEQRAQIAATALPQLQKMGIDVEGMNLDDHLDDNSLDSFISATKPYTVVTGQAPSKSVVGNQILTNEGGKAYAVNTVFDRDTGGTNLVKTEIGPSGNLINRMGETSETAMERAVRLREQQAEIDRINGIRLAAGQSQIKLDAEGKMVPIIEEQEKSKKFGAGMAATALDIVDLGEKAAPIIPRVERGMELLGKVDTGGFDAQMKAIADYTGADTADAAELQSIFSEQLLSQMQSMKGLGAMSEGDRKAIESGIASWGKSAAGNKRILQNYLSVLKRQKNNALMEIDRQGKDKFQGSYERIKGSSQEAPSTAAPAKPIPTANKEVNWSDL